MNPRQRAAIAKAKQTRLLQTIERYERNGTPTSALGAYYQIIPIPTADTMEPVEFRLWVQGHAKEVYPNIAAARKGMKERVRRDPERDLKSPKGNSNATTIPF